MTIRRRFNAITSALCMALVVSLIPGMTFAETSMSTISIKKDAQDGVTRTANIYDYTVNENVLQTSKGFVIEADQITFCLPQTGNDKIYMQFAEEMIGRTLPKAFSKSKGSKLEDNTIIYDSTDESAEIILAGLRETQGNKEFNALCQSLIIKNALGLKEYSSKFNLPEGYSLVMAEDYYGDNKIQGQANEDCVFIVNNKNEIIDVIELSGAIDSNGNQLPVHYKIIGDNLAQIVDANDDTVFPIIVPLLDHPNETRKVELTRRGTQNVISRIKSDIADAEGFTGTPAYWIVNGVTGIVTGAFGLAADGITLWIIKPTHIKRLTARKEMYEEKYQKMKSLDKLDVFSTLKWQRHGSNDGRYVIYKENLYLIIYV